MKPCRFPHLCHLAGAFVALALAGLAAPSAAQDGGPVPPLPEMAPAPAAAAPALVAIPPAGDAAAMVDNIKLSDNPLSTVLDMLEQLTGRSVIRPQQLPTPTFTFNSHGPISKRDAVIAIESLLSLNNIAVAPMGEKFIKVVVITNIKTEAPELVLGSLRDQPPSGKIVSKLFRLAHLDTTTFQNQVQPFLSPGFGAVVPFQNSNTLLVTDTISNLQRLEYVLVEVDKPRDLVTKFYTLKYAQAQAVSEKIKSLIETTRSAFNRQTGGQTAGMPMPPGMPPPQTGGEVGGDASAGLGAALISATTSLNFDERTNQVILVTDTSSVHFYDNLIEKLDVQADPSTKIDVVQIQHAQATEVASLLSTFVSGSTGSSSRSSSSSGRSSTTRQQRSRETFPGLNRPATPTPQVNPQPAVAGTGERNTRFSEFMTIIADERSNAIVVSGTQDDLNLIRELIKQIDVVLPQVQIDVLIASVTLSNTIQRGIDAFTGITVVANKVTGIKAVTGPSFGISDLLFNTPKDAEGNKLKTTVSGTLTVDTAKNGYSNVRVLSVPSITTTSNQEATITVAKAVPIITSAYSDVSSTVGARNSYTYQNIGLELTVKPLIGLDGTIQMEVEQSADDIDKYNADSQPLISKRSAKSFVSVQDGEIIVLGGLQKQSTSKSGQRFPLLGEIPVLGYLFGSNSRVKDRDEIIFFIQPRILRTTAEADKAARAQVKESPVAPLMEKRLRQTVVLPAEPLVK